MNNKKSLIDPDKDIAKVIFPLTTRFGQTCSICGLFYFLDEILFSEEYGYICLKCEEVLKK